MTLQAGDRVKLTKRVCESFSRSKDGRVRKFSWAKRRGHIVTITGQNDVMIKWDDRVSLDQWPIAAVEKVEANHVRPERTGGSDQRSAVKV